MNPLRAEPRPMMRSHDSVTLFFSQQWAAPQLPPIRIKPLRLRTIMPYQA